MCKRGWMGGIAAGAVALTAAIAAPASAQEKAWSLDVGADYSTRYLFRGVPLLGENEVIVPHATFGLGGFSAYYYGYLGDIDAASTFSGNAANYHEDDLGADYTFSLGETFSLTVGAVSYMYSRETEEEIFFADTYELYAIASFDVFLAPTISYWQDMDAIEGGYLQIAVSNSIPLGEKASLDWSAAVGIDFGYNLPAGTAEDLGLEESSGDLNDLLFGVDIPVQINDWFYVHAMIQQSIALDVLDDLGVDDETVVTGGVGFTF